MNRAEELKQNMYVKLTYLKMVTALLPAENGGILNEDVHKVLKTVDEFLKKADEEQLVNSGQDIYTIVNNIYSRYKDTYAPKVNLRKIARKIEELFSQESDIYSKGVKFGWLSEVIDCANLSNGNYIPSHALLGLGTYAGRVNIKEETLLKDSFIMLKKAQQNYGKMITLSNDSNSDEISSLAQIACTFSRQSMAALTDFMEVYIKSIVYDFAVAKRSELEEEKFNKLLSIREEKSLLSFNLFINYYNLIKQEISEANNIEFSYIESLFNEVSKYATIINEYHGFYGDSNIFSVQWNLPEYWVDINEKYGLAILRLAKVLWNEVHINNPIPKYLNNLEFIDNLEAITL